MNKEVTKIKEFMKANRITYEMLSQMSGIPISTLNYIFTGRTANPRMDTIKAIQSSLGMLETWTSEEIAQNITSTRRVEITPEEDDLLYLYQRIGEKLGKAGQETFKEIGEVLLQMKRSS